MNTLDAVTKKVKGKAQQVQGDLQQMSGHHVKGGIQKLKGKANEFIADTHLRANDKDGDPLR